MKFQVPQFIETETKLIGPFTLKQFLWFASGGAILLLLAMILPIYVFFILAIPIGGLFFSLAFVKINEAPLVDYFMYAINYFLSPKQYVFKKEEDKLEEIIISDDPK